MKLFENGVGRPSKKILRKRKIVKISILAGAVSLIAIIVGVITLLINSSNSYDLKGALSNTFTIKFDSNGGTGKMSNQIITHGKSTKLSKNKFTKSGKEFEGWVAKRIVNGQELYRGCKTHNACPNNKADWLSQKSIKSYYIYKNELKVSVTGRPGEIVTMIAKWKGEKFPSVKTTNTTKKTNSTKQNVSGSKNKSIFDILFEWISPSKQTTTTKKKTTTTTKTKTTTKKNTTTSTKKKTTTKRSVANDNIKETKLLNKNTCMYPFSSVYCKNVVNDSVKKIQQMLKTLGFYSSNEDGKYSDATRIAVENFQKAYNISPVDGVVGYKELITLAENEKINAQYFIVKYQNAQNSINTTIHGTSTIVENGNSSINQVILRGIGDKISDTNFNHKYGASHVGYYVKRKVEGTTYHFGCKSKACTASEAKWYTSSEKQKYGDKFNYYIYEKGQNLIETGKNKGTVILTPGYCDAMYNAWDKSKSSCKIDTSLYVSGVATGYLLSPLGAKDTKDYSQIDNSKYFPKRSKSGDFHGAIDLGGDYGVKEGTSIYAMDGGTITVLSNYNDNCYYNEFVCGKSYNAFGKSLIIDHGNGYKTKYAHLSEFIVKEGKVKKGQLIGKAGNTGRSKGAHLHLELINIKVYESNNGDSNREYVKSASGRGLMNAALYINKNKTYVGQNK